MDRKMLVLDIDGTLTNSKKEITPATKAAITRVLEEGHVVVIASGRPTPGTKRVCEELELKKYSGYVLSYNGARITRLSDNTVVHQKVLDKKYIPEIFEYCIKNDMGMMTYEDNDAITGTRIDEYMLLEARINSIGLRSIDNFVEYVNFPVNKCLLTKENVEAEKACSELGTKYKGELSIYRSEPFFVEIMPEGVDKAASLEVLRNILGIERENIVCCGDGFNDLSMIKYAGVGVSMANGCDACREAADYIAPSNDQDGLVDVIKKYFNV
ncbi:MAG: HAD family phosphatase [Clostridia bacterium]|nr:HAD family phosphatase [Clostridia bacterium]